jgi:hypothetical protein
VYKKFAAMTERAVDDKLLDYLVILFDAKNSNFCNLYMKCKLVCCIEFN